MTTPEDDAVTEDDREGFDDGRPDAANEARAALFAADTLERGALHADILSRMFGEVDEEIAQTLGRYVIERELGEGGMGVVYLAHDPELDRKVALKLLREHMRPSEGEQTEHRLQLEARAMARLQHPNVVNVHDVGRHRDRLFLAMEYVQGRTLARWLSDDPAPSSSEIARVFIDAGRGLAAAHAADMVHRDFKPENVLIGDDGVVKVTDFGIAIAMQAAERDGAPRAGTPRYMSPEQLRGQVVDPRSDQFSFCVALYEALLGCHPFAEDERANPIGAILMGELRAPPVRHGVPGWMYAAIVRGLSKEPDDRWPSMDALLHTLQRDPAARRRRILWGTVALLGASALAFAMGRSAAPEPVDPCAEGREKSAAVWGQPQHDALEARFSAQSEGFGAASFAATAQSLDTWVQEWGDAYAQLCGTRHERTDEGYEQRMTCLERQRGQVGTLVTLLGEADASLVSEAPHLAHDLPPTRECTEGPLDPSQPPAEIADEVETIRRELAEIEVFRRAHQVEGHLERLAELRERAESLGYPRLLAEIKDSHAGELMTRDRFDEAKTELRELYGMSLETGDMKLALKAMTGLQILVPSARTEVSEFAREEWNRTAQHLSKNLGQPVAAELNRRSAYMNSLRYHARADELRAELQSAFDFVARTVGEGTPFDIPLLTERARFLIETMKLDEALASIRRARELVTSWVGPTHPDMLVVLHLEAQVLGYQGRYDEALTAAREGLALEAASEFHGERRRQLLAEVAQIEDLLGHHAKARAAYEELLGAPVPNADDLDSDGVQHANSLCFVLYTMGEYEQAQAVCEQTLLACDDLTANAKMLEAIVLNNLALIARARSRMDDSLAYDQRALAICESLGLPDLRVTVYSWIGIGESYLGLDQPELALEPLSKALEIRRSAGVLSAEIGEAECLLARATWATAPSERDAAVRMATEGLQRMRAGGPAWKRQAAACQAWVEAHLEARPPAAP